ncbi:GNAT family N-acetyltransferase [Novosphingobium sp.]|uniref:GNAT family N-acetyltransferase n=1 Tax=Novosphingobium sp. TaxID=1874826 RepID=UPI0025F0EBEE|nr:GNAT family N-acetyltransferase [Novosphingobium sp.]MCC6926973.1 GNAT family N-acetyltransferase [Novosphingobium sp.]
MLADETAPRIQEMRTRTGKTLAVRPVTVDDEALLADFYDRVSDEDRRFRFFTPRKHLTHEQLVPLVDVDHFRTESFLAFDEASDAVVAHAMLACDGPLDTGEIAVAVCKNWRGQGVGWAMLDVLAQAAQERGLRRVIAIEDRENHAAIELEREKGFTPHGVEDDPHVVMLEKLLR